MPVSHNFDMDLLRSLAALADGGSLAEAGRRLGRTQAALSLQMRRLEEQAGNAPLFDRHGRRLVLTPSGEQLLGYARRILALNDEAQRAVRRSGVAGRVRLGTCQDFGESWLPGVLAQFRQTFVSVGLEVRVDRGSRMVAEVDAGALDVALALGLGDRPNAIPIGSLPLAWIAHRDFAWTADGGAALPLAVFDAPCRFRTAACAALDAAGIPWQVAVTSQSLYGVWAAVNARLGVTVRTPEGLLPDLEVADARLGLPSLGRVDVSLFVTPGAHSPAVTSLVELLAERLRPRLAELEARQAPATRPRLARAA